MQFLKGLFWFLVAVLLAVFAVGNWTRVSINLWGGLVAEVNLPLLLLLAFLVGLVPVLIYHHAVRWRLRTRLANADRAIADLRAAAIRPATDPGDLPAAEPVPVPPPMEPGSA